MIFCSTTTSYWLDQSISFLYYNIGMNQFINLNFPVILIHYLVSYQREVDKGKLTAIASFEKLTFRVRALCRRKVYVCFSLNFLCPDKGLTLEISAFQNSLWWLIYPYQLHVNNQLSVSLPADTAQQFLKKYRLTCYAIPSTRG